MNKSMKDHLGAHWLKYIAVLLATLAIWGAVFDALAAPKPNEQVVITFFGDKMDAAGINARLGASMQDFTEQRLKNVYISQQWHNDAAFTQLIMARNETSDIIIVAEKYLENGEGDAALVPQNVFRALGTGYEPDYLKKVIGERADGLEYYYFEDEGGAKRPIGIYLNSLEEKESKNNFESHYTGEYRCVAFFSQTSVNLGGMYGVGEIADTAAIDTLLYLLSSQ